MLYKLRNLKKIFGQRIVLDLKELCLEQGQVIGLLGPNGAGKTTLLEILGFLSAADSGEVWFKGKQVYPKVGKLRDLRRKVVLVQQHPIMFTTTVAKNLAFPLDVRHVSRRAQGKVIDELLDLVGMRAFKKARAHHLSGGETQRIAIARALACMPEVMLFDEPTSSVDMEHQVAIERIIRDINSTRGISVILTTHDMMQATRLAKHTTFLFEGRLAQSGYENVFNALVVPGEGGTSYCLVHDSLRLIVRNGNTGPVRIGIDPNGVQISKPASGPPPENTYCGRVVQLADEKNMVRALVDVGIPLCALVPKEQFSTMHVDVGATVWLTCPPDSINIIPESCINCF